ncbi:MULTISPECIES: hypothetical protein [Thalassospira]|jgi:hypothetical protein|uniref:Uncharacterized protein n=1 Tax=Thalassospira lohafexi TaxID=744227 RepID=A0A2N3L142_9PROT|nr:MULTISPECIES: hypothetical protein [Thalassospira]PKR56535.1 hypothetical protein COO92_20060 [Thalassospira lohafexi]|tara:strand:- start:5749 stop:6171 length:423 start_codon:yes stop_codon:yes gene_type:complete
MHALKKSLIVLAFVTSSAYANELPEKTFPITDTYAVKPAGDGWAHDTCNIHKGDSVVLLGHAEEFGYLMTYESEMVLPEELNNGCQHGQDVWLTPDQYKTVQQAREDAGRAARQQAEYDRIRQKNSNASSGACLLDNSCD